MIRPNDTLPLSTTPTEANSVAREPMNDGAEPRKVRRRGPPPPRFLADMNDQLDYVGGCLELAVESDHLARRVWAFVNELDLVALRSQYSYLGRRGFDPARLLAAFIYGSLERVHAASALARRARDDAALRWLLGGHVVNERKLAEFRARNGAFLQQALQRTVTMAVERGLIDPRDLAVDSVRVRADAATASIRTVTRSKERIAELEAVDAESLTEAARLEREQKLSKHHDALKALDESGRTSMSVTDKQAALMKFPSGASLPGHRVQVGACRTDLRFVVSAFVDGSPTDCGMLERVTESVLAGLTAAGISITAHVPQVTADGGYVSEADLRYASTQRARVDLLVSALDAPTGYVRGSKTQRKFGRESFEFGDDGSAKCPAGTTMKGPADSKDGIRTWRGVGCPACPLRASCTSGKERTLTENMRTRALRDDMKRRLAEPGAKERYARRIGTVEPVFSYLSDTMGFTRASSRRTETVDAEILLKLLAYNFTRLQSKAGHKPVFPAYVSAFPPT